MFYNGICDLEDAVTYRLSELFQKPVEDPSIELVVTCLNVNEGHNKELMEACKTLNGYSIFVSKVRKYREEDVLRDFFTEYRAEVRTVAILEYSAERHLQYEKEDSYNSGYDAGYNTGYNTGNNAGHSTGINDTTALFSWLKKNQREADILNAIDDHAFLDKLFEEYNKANNT